MTDYPETAARFAVETQNHEMTVLHDQGLYRHVRFSAREFGSYWFDLITVPGALIFQGDGNSYVFRRLDDMFVFFRSGIWKDGSLHINPGYWSQKLNSDRDHVMTYSMDAFNRHVDEALKDAEETFPGVTGAWREHVEEQFNTEYEESARDALEQFEFGEGYEAVCSCGMRIGSPTDQLSYVDALILKKRHLKGADQKKHRASVESVAFTFDDWHEWDLTDFHWWFLWACHGILWGIQQYDAAKAEQVAGGEAA